MEERPTRARRRRRWATLVRLAPALPATGFVALACLWPVGRLLARSLVADEGKAGAPLVRLFRDAFYRRALGGTLGLALVVALSSVALCLPAAFGLARGRFALRGIVRAAFAVPLSLSGVVVGFLAIAMLGHAGALSTVLGGRLAGSAYGLGGLGVAYLYFEVPRATLTLDGAIASIDEGLVDAARTLGATPFTALRLVVVPLAWPAVRAAFAVTFAAAIGSFGVALLLAARFPVLPVELYRALTGTMEDGLAAAMALVLGAAALGVLLLSSARSER